MRKLLVTLYILAQIVALISLVFPWSGKGDYRFLFLSPLVFTNPVATIILLLIALPPIMTIGVLMVSLFINKELYSEVFVTINTIIQIMMLVVYLVFFRGIFALGGITDIFQVGFWLYGTALLLSLSVVWIHRRFYSANSLGGTPSAPLGRL
jgi:hypothetical protein